MQRIRIGVMGCANIAQRLVIPAMVSMTNHFKLVAIASRTQEKAALFSERFQTEGITGYENLLDRSDIEAIYLPIPTGVHYKWIKAALVAGKHVFAEKSLAMNEDETEELVALAESKQLLLMENFMFRHHAQHQEVWRHLNAGSIGSLRLFRSQFCFPPLDRNNFRYNRDAGGGSLLDAGAYTTRASTWFLGKGLDVISAALAIDKALDTDIYGSITFINDKGVVAQVGFGFDNFYQCNYELLGSSGRLFAERAFTPKPDEKTTILFERPGDSRSIEINPDNHFRNILEAFHSAICSGHHKEHLDDIREQGRLLTAVRKSAIKTIYESTNHRV